MYAVMNVKKFLDDHPELVGSRSSTILERANKIADRGIFVAAEIDDILGDAVLVQQFLNDIDNDPEHERIGEPIVRITGLIIRDIIETERLE